MHTCDESGGYTTTRVSDLGRHQEPGRHGRPVGHATSTCSTCGVEFADKWKLKRHGRSCKKPKAAKRPRRRLRAPDRLVSETAVATSLAAQLSAEHPLARFSAKATTRGELRVHCGNEGCGSVWGGTVDRPRADAARRHMERLHPLPPKAPSAEGHCDRRVELGSGERVLATTARELLDRDRHVMLRLPADVRTVLHASVGSGELELCTDRADPLLVFGTTASDGNGSVCGIGSAT